MTAVLGSGHEAFNREPEWPALHLDGGTSSSETGSGSGCSSSSSSPATSRPPSSLGADADGDAQMTATASSSSSSFTAFLAPASASPPGAALSPQPDRNVALLAQLQQLHLLRQPGGQPLPALGDAVGRTWDRDRLLRCVGALHRESHIDLWQMIPGPVAERVCAEMNGTLGKDDDGYTSVSALRSKVKELRETFDFGSLCVVLGYQGLPPAPERRSAKRRRIDGSEAGAADPSGGGTSGGSSSSSSSSSSGSESAAAENQRGAAADASPVSELIPTSLQAARSEARRWKDRAHSLFSVLRRVSSPDLDAMSAQQQAQSYYKNGGAQMKAHFVADADFVVEDTLQTQLRLNAPAICTEAFYACSPAEQRELARLFTHGSSAMGVDTAKALLQEAGVRCKLAGLQHLPLLLAQLINTDRFSLSSFTAHYWNDVLKLLTCKSAVGMRWSEAVLFFCGQLASRTSEGTLTELRGDGAAGLSPDAQRGPVQLDWFALPLPSYTTLAARNRARGPVVAGIQREILDLVARCAREAARPVHLQHDEMSLNAGFETHGTEREGETDYAGLRVGKRPDREQRRQQVADTTAQMKAFDASLAAAAERAASAGAAADGKAAASDADVKAVADFRRDAAAAVTRLQQMRAACADVQADRVTRLGRKAARAATLARKRQAAELEKAAEEKRAPVPQTAKMNNSPQEAMWRFTYGEAGVAITAIDRALTSLGLLGGDDAPLSANLDKAAVAWHRASASAAAAVAAAADGSEVADTDVDDDEDDGDADDDTVDLTALARARESGEAKSNNDPLVAFAQLFARNLDAAVQSWDAACQREMATKLFIINAEDVYRAADGKGSVAKPVFVAFVDDSLTIAQIRAFQGEVLRSFAERGVLVAGSNYDKFSIGLAQFSGSGQPTTVMALARQVSGIVDAMPAAACLDIISSDAKRQQNEDGGELQEAEAHEDGDDGEDEDADGGGSREQRRRKPRARSKPAKPKIADLRAQAGPILFRRRIEEQQRQSPAVNFASSFAVPAICQYSGKPLPQCTCANHALKSIRQNISKGNRKGAPALLAEHYSAFVDLARAHPEIAPPLLISEKLAQNVALARQLVSEPVSQAMRRRGHVATAELLDTMRGFIEASDDAGYCDASRDTRMLRVLVYFGFNPADGIASALRFFPPQNVIKGFPRVTVEGILVTATHRFLLQQLLRSQNLPPTFHPRIQTTDMTESLFSLLRHSTVLGVKLKLKRLTIRNVAALGGHGHIKGAPPMHRRGRTATYSAQSAGDDAGSEGKRDPADGGGAAPAAPAPVAAPAAAAAAAAPAAAAVPVATPSPLGTFVPPQRDDAAVLAKNKDRVWLREQLTGVSARPAIGYDGIRGVAQEKVKSSVTAMLTGGDDEDGDGGDDHDAVAPDGDDDSPDDLGRSSFVGTAGDISAMWSRRERGSDQNDGFGGDDSDARDSAYRAAQLASLQLTAARGAARSSTGRAVRPSRRQSDAEIDIALLAGTDIFTRTAATAAPGHDDDDEEDGDGDVAMRAFSQSRRSSAAGFGPLFGGAGAGSSSGGSGSAGAGSAAPAQRKPAAAIAPRRASSSSSSAAAAAAATAAGAPRASSRPRRSGSSKGRR